MEEDESNIEATRSPPQPEEIADESSKMLAISEEVIHVIYFKPISERPTSKSFHKSSVKLVWIDLIGTFL